MQWIGQNYYLLVLMNILSYPAARGDYTLRVQVHSYANPTNRCAGCGSQQGCCDTFQREQCNGRDRCDNVFFSCVRTLGTPAQTLEALEGTIEVEDRAGALQCLQPPGVSNPMEFQINAMKWEGSQFYLDVTDSDGNRDDLVESFAIDIGSGEAVAGGGMNDAVSFPGLFGFANVTISFEVVCQPGFVGENCVPIRQICSTEPCSNNGTCLQSASGFTCACQDDFTGETCETRINDCQDVDCNNGTCVDGVLSFTCWCEEGFTGESCEQITTISDTPTNATTDMGAGANSGGSNNVGAVAGAVVGCVIAIVGITTVIVLGLLLLWRSKANKASKASKGNEAERANGDSTAMDNPVYAVGGASIDKRDLDNPIYGLQDEDVTYDMPHFDADAMYYSVNTS